MRRRKIAIRIILLSLPLLSLAPVGMLTADWVRYAGLMQAPEDWPHSRAFDWVHWEDVDGAITAVYVFPKGLGARAGIREGDVVYEVEGLVLYSAADLRGLIEGIPPGTTTRYTVQRDGEFFTFDVALGKYPTFLYPISSNLWFASTWGFTLSGFFHVLALLIVVPLAFRSQSAWLSALLITASSIWVLGNLARMLWILLLGPADPTGATYALGFEALTLISLVGWIAFPVLLTLHVLSDLPAPTRPTFGWTLPLWLPPVLLGALAVATSLVERIGPVTLDLLIGPILFYVSCYVATATGLSFVSQETKDTLMKSRSGWSQAGTLLVFTLSLAATLIVLNLPPTSGIDDTTVGWSILAVQLLSVLPVGLESFATLKYGRIDDVLTRTLTYLFVLGVLFFFLVGGLYLLDPYVSRIQLPAPVVVGLFVVALLVVFERVARWIQPRTRTILRTERQRAQQRLIRFSDRMRAILDVRDLVLQTVDRIGEAMDARAGVLLLRPSGDEEGTGIQATYHPEPPYVTRSTLEAIWPHFAEDGRVWSANRELNERALPSDVSALLRRHGVELAVPVSGEERPIGLLLLAGKRSRRAVYNLADVDLLRSTCSQLALALSRLRLVEREKQLVRESAEAELVALRAQINPHFLFNTLNTIAALIEEKPAEAEQTVEHLAALFRHILQVGSQPFVRLDVEVRQVRRYLAIEQARFGDRLRIEFDLEPELRDWPVPAFALQTLVENAVLHGIGKTVDGGVVRVAARRSGEHSAEVLVHDTGPGLPALFGREEERVGDGAFLGIGLRNVAARLEKLHGRNDLLRMRSAPGEGTSATMVLPWTDLVPAPPSSKPADERPGRVRVATAP